MQEDEIKLNRNMKSVTSVTPSFSWSNRIRNQSSTTKNDVEPKMSFSSANKVGDVKSINSVTSQGKPRARERKIAQIKSQFLAAQNRLIEHQLSFNTRMIIIGVSSIIIVSFLVSALYLIASTHLKYALSGRWGQRLRQLTAETDVAECREYARALSTGTTNFSMGETAVLLMLCQGLHRPDISGLGGGFVGVFYKKETNEANSIVAIGKIPPNWTNNNPSSSMSSMFIPAAVWGYERLLQETNSERNLSELVKHFLRRFSPGQYRINVSLELQKSINIVRNRTFLSPELKDYIKDPGGALVIFRWLKIIASQGSVGFYKSLGKMFRIVAKVSFEYMQDRRMVEVLKAPRLQVENLVGFHSFLSTSPPSAGIAMLNFIALLNEIKSQSSANLDTAHSAESRLQLINGIRWAMVDRNKLQHCSKECIELRLQTLLKYTDSSLIDIEMGYFLNASLKGGDKGYGTQTLLVMPNGDAFAAVSTNNQRFGNGMFMPAIINGLDVFERRAADISTLQYDQSATFRLSQPPFTICPLIGINKLGEVQVVLGGLRGLWTLGNIAQVLYRYFVQKMSLQKSIAMDRIGLVHLHNYTVVQVSPMVEEV